MESSQPSFTGDQDLPGVLGKFEFIRDLPIYKTEQPYEAVGTLPPEQESMRTNTKYDIHEVLIQDLRPSLHRLSFERNGFEYIRRPDLCKFDLKDENEMKSYLLGIVDLVKEKFEPVEVIVYNYNYRKAGLSPQKEETSGDHLHPSPPVTQLHTDGTHEGGFRRVRLHLRDDEITKYFDGSWRLRLVTVWRPVHLVHDDPLALLDPASLESNDLLITERPSSEEYVGQIAYVKYNPKQRFYWLSDQSPEELLLFSAFDSDRIEQAVPHASFKIPNVASDSGPPRESIDVRAIVITKGCGVDV